MFDFYLLIFGSSSDIIIHISILDLLDKCTVYASISSVIRTAVQPLTFSLSGTNIYTFIGTHSIIQDYLLTQVNISLTRLLIL